MVDWWLPGCPVPLPACSMGQLAQKKGHCGRVFVSSVSVFIINWDAAHHLFTTTWYHHQLSSQPARRPNEQQAASPL